MTDSFQDTRVRLIAQGPDLWRVQMLFEDGQDGLIPQKLREIKADLARSFGVPDNLLEYVQLLNKRRTKHGLLVEIQIRKQPIPAGAPIVRYLPLTGEDGSEYSNMLVEADIFPLDQYGKPTSRRAIESRLALDGVLQTLIDWGIVEGTIEEAQAVGQVLRNVQLGTGTLPRPGRNSELAYPVQSADPGERISAWIGVREVLAGEAVAIVETASTGGKAGMNVFGREVEPKKPISTRLEAGHGCSVSARGIQLKADRTGLLVLSRHYSDRRTKDSSTTQPEKLVAEIFAADELGGGIVLKETFSRATIIRGSLKAGSEIRSGSHLLIAGSVDSECTVDCQGSLRITGNAGAANISTKGHLAIGGWARDSFISSDRSVQIHERADQCTIYAREIIAPQIEGGMAEAQTHLVPHLAVSEGAAASVQVQRRKFLEAQQSEGSKALAELREQFSIVIDLFGPAITQQVTEENVQLMLLRWLRQQKSLGITGYSYQNVQDFRNILGIVPSIRKQVAEIGTELREISQELKDISLKEKP